MKFYHCLLKILKKNQNVVDKEWQRAITLNRNSPWSLFFYNKCSSCGYQCVVFAKSDEIPSLPVLKELVPSPFFSIINVHLLDINVFAKFYEIPSLTFEDTEKPKRCRWTDRRTENVITVYPPPAQQTQFAGGIITKDKMAVSTSYWYPSKLKY